MGDYKINAGGMGRGPAFVVSADRAEAQRSTHDLAVYGRTHGTWFGVGTLIKDLSVTTGQRIRLVAVWSADSAETYPVFDSASQSLVDQREALWISWFATAGAFDDSTTGRGEDDPTAWSDNSWQSPAVAGEVSLWLVLHDSRGGVDFATYTMTVAP